MSGRRRKSGLISVCAFVALAWSAMPVEACGPPGAPMGGGAPAGGESHNQPADNGAADRLRQGAADDAAGADDGGAGRPRSGAGEQNQNRVNAIDALGGIIGAADRERCNALRSQLAALKANKPTSRVADQVTSFVLDATHMTTAQLDEQIAGQRAQLTYNIGLQEEGNQHRKDKGLPPLPVQRTSPILDYLVALRTSQLLGVGQDEAAKLGARAASGYQNATDDSMDQYRKNVADLESQIANLECDTLTAAGGPPTGAAAPP